MPDDQQRGDRRVPTNASKASDDAFWLEDTYPDASGLFSYKPATTKIIVAESFVALDANVLLWPYELNSASLAEIDRVYGELQSSGRLVVPAQAAREFYKHRARKLAALSEQIEGAITRAKKQPLQGTIPLLQDDEDYKAAQAIAKDIINSSKKLSEKLEVVKTSLQSDVGNDPVSAVYRKHLAHAVVELKGMGRSEILSEVERRARLHIAPGFKDQGKEDGGVGDYIIWRTILQQAEDRQTHCLFVTNEEKADWWVKSGGAFQPRPELLDEYRRASGGHSLHILPLSELLSRFSAKKAVVQGVQALEEASRNRQSLSDLALLATPKHFGGGELTPGRSASRRLDQERAELASILGTMNAELDSVETSLSSASSEQVRNDLLTVKSRIQADRQIVLDRLADNAKAILSFTIDRKQADSWRSHLRNFLHDPEPRQDSD